MQIPLLSSLLGLAGAQAPVGETSGEVGVGGSVAGDAFAQLLASLPAQGGETVEAAGLAKAGQGAAPSAAPPLAADAAQESALWGELEAALSPSASLQTTIVGQTGKLAASGKPVSDTGRKLPVSPELPLAAETALPALETLGLANPLEADPLEELADIAQVAEQPAAAPLAFADLALFQGFGAPESRQTETASRPTAQLLDRQLAAAAVLTAPVAAPAPRTGKDRAAAATDPAAAITSAATTPAAPTPTAQSVDATIPLARTPHERQPIAAPLTDPAVVQQPALQLADPQGTAPEPAQNAPAIEQPAAPDVELGTVIDRLVETRMQSREGRSEVTLPHPDFGRVTLALSLAGQDRLSVAMPDAPAELRAAVGQAFAPTARSETTVSAPEAAQSMGTDRFGGEPRGGDTRRDANSSAGRSDQQRPETANGRSSRSDPTRDERRTANGRGVLA